MQQCQSFPWKTSSPPTLFSKLPDRLALGPTANYLQTSTWLGKGEILKRSVIKGLNQSANWSHRPHALRPEAGFCLAPWKTGGIRKGLVCRGPYLEWEGFKAYL